MTVEELEILITVNIEKALKEFKKLVPEIRQSIKQAQETVSNIDTKQMQSKISQAVQFVKKKMQDLKKSNANNEIAIKVNNKDAQKQISQIQKQIESLQEKISARQIKLDVINPQIDSIVNKTRQDVTPAGINPNSKTMDATVDSALSSNKDFTQLNSQAQKLYTEMEQYNQQLSQAKIKMTQLAQETSKTATTQNKLSSFFSGFKQKIEQVKPSISNLKNNFNGLPKITQNITNNIKGMGAGLKSGLGHVLRYAMALLSLRGIYAVLSSAASSWLSSQNAGAKQLSANIEYMKYAMGSALAPVIQFVVDLVYKLMKAIQSVAYALTGVNIFANASADSYSSMASSAKKASKETKQLAGVHNEINNIKNNEDSDSGSGGGVTPSFDLSQMDNTTNSILDAIKNGNWSEIGVTIGDKLNTAMNNIPWSNIQNTAKSIATNIAGFLNSFISTTDWYQVGNTFAQGLNTIIYFGYSFVTTFDWKKYGEAIGDSINGCFDNIDWEIAGQTLGEGIKGILTTLYTALEQIDWQQIAKDIEIFIQNVDWGGILYAIIRVISSAFMGLGIVIGTMICDAIDESKKFFEEKIEECGGNIVEGIHKGINEGLEGIGQWIYENMIKPIIDSFCSLLGINSPSTVFAEFGKNIMQGLLNGISSLINSINQKWENIKNTAVDIFSNLKNSIVDTWNDILSTTGEIWQNIKTKVKEGASEAWDSITSVFGNVGNWFQEKFSSAWQAVKDVFSTGGKIFEGIKEGILSGLTSIVNAIIDGINKVIKIPFNGINTALKSIRNVNIMGLQPFSWISTIEIPQIPKLEKGGILTKPTLALAGEYAGAKSNPEIVTPQNIMEETFDRTMSKYEGKEKEINLSLTVNVGNTKLGRILLEDLRNMKRSTGKDIEALVGG